VTPTITTIFENELLKEYSNDKSYKKGYHQTQFYNNYKQYETLDSKFTIETYKKESIYVVKKTKTT